MKEETFKMKTTQTDTNPYYTSNREKSKHTENGKNINDFSMSLTDEKKTSIRRWMASLTRLDPRWQIRSYYESIEGDADIFTVWRPCSTDAIKKMVAGEAVGKGLEIKGKSAKKGSLSGFVPYLQIHNNEDKEKVKTLERGGRTRIFFATAEERDVVLEELEPLRSHMMDIIQNAKRTVFLNTRDGVLSLAKPMKHGAAKVSRAASNVTISVTSSVSSISSTIKRSVVSLSSSLRKGRGRKSQRGKEAKRKISLAENIKQRMSLTKKGTLFFIPKGGESSDEQKEWALKRLLWDMDDPSIKKIDDYSPSCYGIELPDRLLWHTLVVEQDISLDDEYSNGRSSEPAFQDMNLHAISKSRENNKINGEGSLVVLFQTSSLKPLDPRGLVMAYEEYGRVLPVVSDFDCFTMGSKGVAYNHTLSEEQMSLLEWCVSNTDEVLNRQAPCREKSWTHHWLDILKSCASKGFQPRMPKYGFGDQKSYSIVEQAVDHLQICGAVRHGPECFNFYFPQELDQEFLIISNEDSHSKWRYVGVEDLQEFLRGKIEQGFTFPLNPKWVLCDPGWKDIYDRLLSRQNPLVKASFEVWFPPCIREKIEDIHTRHPNGFSCDKPTNIDGTEAMDLAMLTLGRHLAFRRAKAKLLAIVIFNQLLESVREKRKINESKE